MATDNANHDPSVIQSGSSLVVPRINIHIVQDNITNRLNITIDPPNCVTNAQLAAMFAELAKNYATASVKFESDLIQQMSNMAGMLKKQNGGT